MMNCYLRKIQYTLLILSNLYQIIIHIFDSFFNIKDNYIPSEWYTINNGHDRCKEFSQYKMDNLNFLYEYFISIKEHRKLKLNELKKIKL